MSNVWMAVSADEYELPFATADTARQLGDKLGLTKAEVTAKAYKDKKRYTKTSNCGKKPKYRIVKVEIEENGRETE